MKSTRSVRMPSRSSARNNRSSNAEQSSSAVIMRGSNGAADQARFCNLRRSLRQIQVLARQSDDELRQIDPPAHNSTTAAGNSACLINCPRTKMSAHASNESDSSRKCHNYSDTLLGDSVARLRLVQFRRLHTNRSRLGDPCIAPTRAPRAPGLLAESIAPRPRSVRELERHRRHGPLKFRRRPAPESRKENPN